MKLCHTGHRNLRWKGYVSQVDRDLHLFCVVLRVNMHCSVQTSEMQFPALLCPLSLALPASQCALGFMMT